MPSRSRSPRRWPREKSHRRWLSTVEVKPHGPHNSTLFFFHGFMGDAASYAEADDGVYWRRDIGLKVILVNAPQRQVTCCREVTNAWYDYITDKEGEFFDVIDTEHCDDVTAAVHRLMKKEFDIVGPGNVSLAGYSQGGTIALNAGLTWKGPKLGAIYAISTSVLAITPAVNPGCKIRAFHGLADETFPWHKWAREGYSRLAACGADIEVQVQEGIGHVDADWEAAVIRKCFNDGEHSDVLKLQPVQLPSTEIESAKGLEAMMRTARICIQLSHRFALFLASAWQHPDHSKRSSLKDLKASMSAWQVNEWAKQSIKMRAGVSSSFDLVSCSLQSASKSSCWPLPNDESEDQILPRTGVLVMHLGVKQDGLLTYLTRTVFLQPTNQERLAYRTAGKVLEFAIASLHTGAVMRELRTDWTNWLDEQVRVRGAQSRSVKSGKFKVDVWALTVKGQHVTSEPLSLSDVDIVTEGAYLVTVGFLPGQMSMQQNSDEHHLTPIWLQDTVWVQGRQGGSTFTLTQNASKEETCVMLNPDEDGEPEDDLLVATNALSDVWAILQQQDDTSALAKQLKEVLSKANVQELLNRSQLTHE